jgi:hemolysin III
MNWEQTYWLGDKEERANTITHAAACVLSLSAVVGCLLYGPPSSVANRWGFAVYGTTMFLVYFCSTLSHGVREPRLRHHLRAWDQGMIYLMIVGTYTPFAIRYLPQPLLSWVLICTWLAASVGFYSKVLAHHRVKALGTASYLLLGWLPAIPFINRVPWGCVAWMFVGGVVYSIGVVFLMQDRRRSYFHAIWHLCVIAASAIHFIGILRYTFSLAES